MADSLDVVLEFLRKNKFTKAEAALRTELGIRPEYLDGSSEKILMKEELWGESRPSATSSRNLASGSQSREISQEFIVKEIEVGRNGNGMENKKFAADLYPWNSTPVGSTVSNDFSNILISEQQKIRSGSLVTDKKNANMGTKPPSCGSSQGSGSKDNYMDNPWSKREEPVKECSVKTVFPSPSSNASTSYDNNQMEWKKKPEKTKITEATKEQLIDESNNRSFDTQFVAENHGEEFPRLPPVRLKSVDKLVNMNWEERTNNHGSGTKQCSDDSTFLIGSFLDVPVGQELNGTGRVVDYVR